MCRPAAAWASPCAALGVALLAGCGGGGAPSPEDARAAEARAAEARLAELEAAQEAKEARIRELEGRLALSRAEASELRAAADRRGSLAPRETVRIGGDRQPAGATDGIVGGADAPGLEEPFALGEPEDEPGDDGPRPVLRLYGTRAEEPSGGPTPPLEVPAPPPGVSLRLPVRTVPWDPRTRTGAALTAAPRPAPATPPPVDASAERASYERALALLTARRFDEAVDAFTRHLERWAGGRHATSALYWRGEAHYAARRYERAQDDFRRVVTRSPHGRRAPDALYKLALCQRRRGDLDASRATLARLAREFPDSVAARLAAQEDAS